MQKIKTVKVSENDILVHTTKAEYRFPNDDILNRLMKPGRYVEVKILNRGADYSRVYFQVYEIDGKRTLGSGEREIF